LGGHVSLIRGLGQWRKEKSTALRQGSSEKSWKTQIPLKRARAKHQGACEGEEKNREENRKKNRKTAADFNLKLGKCKKGFLPAIAEEACETEISKHCGQKKSGGLPKHAYHPRDLSTSQKVISIGEAGTQENNILREREKKGW